MKLGFVSAILDGWSFEEMSKYIADNGIVGSYNGAVLSEIANGNEVITQELKVNPRYATITRNGVIYNSYIRVVEGGDMMNPDVNISDVKYIITIKKL